VQQRGGSLTIRLSPESLGHVRVDLEMSQGRVNAALHASTERAQEAMVKSITMLRSSLESKGLTVERLTVQLAPTQTNTNTQTGGDQTSQDGSRNQSNADRDASDGQSRGRDGQRHGGHGRNGFAFDERFEEAFGLEPDDPRAQTLRLRLSAIG
jgi:flagellar hook-length control protein FliK